MELSKEVYPKSPDKKDIQSVVNDLLQDEKIVGKKKKNEKKEKKEKKEEKKEKKEKKENPEEKEKKEKKENPEEKKEENPEEKKEEKEEEKPIEKKRRGRPPKKNIQLEDKSESKLEVDVEVDVEVEVLPKKPRGRPRKIKLPSTPQHDPIQHHPTHHDPTHHDPTHILPLIQSISSTHLLHTLPDKTLKYIIFLIHLSYHTPITQNTLHTLIHTSIHSFKHFSPLRTTFIKHSLFSSTQGHIMDKKI